MKKEAKYLLVVLVVCVVAALAGYKLFLQNEVKSSPTLMAELPAHPMVTSLTPVDSFSYGPVDAKVTVVEFFDPECESCAAVAPIVKEQMKNYEGRVRWVFRYMPYHGNSKNAIAALESAKRQNLFLEVLAVLFEKQSVWGEKQESTEKQIIEIVTAVKGINRAQFLKDYQDPAHQEIIKRDQIEGQQAGVKGTPSFFVNGNPLPQLNFDTLKQMIDAGLGDSL